MGRTYPTPTCERLPASSQNSLYTQQPSAPGSSAAPPLHLRTHTTQALYIPASHQPRLLGSHDATHPLLQTRPFGSWMAGCVISALREAADARQLAQALYASFPLLLDIAIAPGHGCLAAGMPRTFKLEAKWFRHCPGSVFSTSP